jgi:hypothetical protein
MDVQHTPFKLTRFFSVMAGLVPAIHVLLAEVPKDVDDGNKAGHAGGKGST